MLRRLRTARFGQIALWLAAFLAVTGAFGLHPEPALSATRAGALPAVGHSPASSTDTDGCPACLAHRPISASRLWTALDAPLLLCRASTVRAPEPVRALPALPHEGRAPPSGA